MQGLQSRASGTRGVGRYTESLVTSLLRKNKKNEFILALNGSLPDRIDYIKEKFNKYVGEDGIIVWYNYLDTKTHTNPEEVVVNVAEGLREIFLAQYNPDVIFSTNLQEGYFEPAVTSVRKCNDLNIKYFTTLHDVVPFFYEKEYLSNELTKKWYTEKIKYVVESDIILTVSNSSKRDIVEKLRVRESKVVVIENGYDENKFNSSESNKRDAETVLKKYGLEKPYVLYIGGNDLHKNIDRLLQAFSLNQKITKNYNLVLGGASFVTDSKIIGKIKKYEIAESVLTPGFVEDDDLPYLYKEAACFIFPSTHEGFGLPALEAMACGTPVIGSRSSSIAEIINNDNALFDPYDIKDIAKKIQKVLNDKKFTENLIKHGLINCKRYSWDNSAEKLLNFIDDFQIKNKKNNNKKIDATKECLAYVRQRKNLIGNSIFPLIAKTIADSIDIDRRKRLYLDISVVVKNDDKSGIQRVVRAVVKEMLSSFDSEYDIVLVYTDINTELFYNAKEYASSICKDYTNECEEIVDFIKGDALLYLDLHPSVAISHINLTKNLRNKGVFVYHVVYDLLPITLPKYFWPKLCEEFTLWLQAISVSDGALCISKSVATELKTYLEKYGTKRYSNFNIGWFHLGDDIENSVPSKGGFDERIHNLISQMRIGLSFLMVGTVEPRKGHKQVLDAMEILWQTFPQCKLIIVGRTGWGMSNFINEIKNNNNFNKKLFLLQGVSDEVLESIYENSSCLIAASEGEGFGLPIIEAAKKKIPLILRDIPVFREVAGPFAHYFENNNNPLTIAETIIKWIGLFKNNAVPLSEGIKRQTWNETSKQILAIIKNGDWEYSIQCGNSISVGLVYDYKSDRLKFKGFSDIEDGFRWSDGNKCEISFVSAINSLDRIIKLNIDTFGKQYVEIFFNNQLVKSQELIGANEIILAGINLSCGVNDIVFKLPMAKSASDKDLRHLGIQFKEISFFSKPVPIKLDKEYTYTSSELIFIGFSGAEQFFRWTDGSTSSINFMYESHLQSESLSLFFGTLGKQRVQIYLNNNPVYTGFFDGDSEFQIDGKGIVFGYNIIRFELFDARQPNERDNRLLALSFRKLILQS